MQRQESRIAASLDEARCMIEERNKIESRVAWPGVGKRWKCLNQHGCRVHPSRKSTVAHKALS